MNKELPFLCKTIENFSKEDQIEILKIISNVNINLVSENNNGTFINMNDLNNDTLLQINNYVEYVLKKNNEINNIENEKDILSKYIIWNGVLKNVIEYKVEHYDLGYHFNAKFIVEAHQPVIRNYDENTIITIPAIIKEQADILKTMQIFSN